MREYIGLFIALILVFFQKYFIWLLLVAGLVLGYRYFNAPKCNGQLLVSISEENLAGDMEEGPYFQTPYGNVFFEPKKAGTFCIELHQLSK